MAVDLDNMTKEQAGEVAISVLAVIMKMSDEAKALGGATTIAGVASLHKMQTSIQKNGVALAKVAAAMLPKPEVGQEKPKFWLEVMMLGSGWAAVLMHTAEEGFPEPWQTGDGRYSTQDQAVAAARDWAAADGHSFEEPPA